MAKPFPQRLRAALGVLFDSTNPREIIRRPLEPRTTGRIVDEVNPTDRRQLVSDSRKLYANVGPAKGAIDAKAMYSVGRSWLPKFEGTDVAWGEQAREWLLNQWYPLADIQGRDFQTALYLMSVSVDRDGDVGALLTEYENSFPAIQLIPTQAIGNPSSDKIDKEGRLMSGPYQGLRCFDGVVVNDQGRPVAYYVEEDGTLLDLENEDEASEYISARDFMLLAEPSWVDQVRGFPGFAHAILDLKDLRTVQGYEKMASALASSIGLLEYNETGMADTSDPTVALGGNYAGAGEIVSKEIFGGTVRHYKANSGSKLEAFKSDRPGDAWQRMMDRLIRNAMSGINWPFELAWDISALGGANTRFIISSAMRTVEDRQDLLRPFAKRAVGYACAKAMKQGILPQSDDWWRWSFTMPPRMTSDYGRDAAAQREDYLQGIINLSDICAERGIDLKQHIAARSAENAALEAANLPVPGLSGKLAPTATEPTPVPVMVPQESAQMTAKLAEGDACPIETQDIAANLANRKRAVDVAHYGPPNPLEPNEDYWKAKAAKFNTTPDKVKSMRCGNCAAFNVTKRMTDCITQGIGSDAAEVEAAGQLGFCEFFDFKCAGLRTCDAWVVGGPITDQKAEMAIPTPNAGEKGSDFISRCMNDPVMAAEYPANDQRYAVCQAQLSVATLAVDTKPTEQMAAEAAKGLEWRNEFNRGGTAVGVARARDISNRANLSEDTIFRMRSYFARHEVDKQGQGFNAGEPGYPSAGRIAWALWGGDAGAAWAERKVAEIENQQD